MNILVYFPYNQRTVEQQSVMEMFVNKGHRVFLLTLAKEGTLHQYARSIGAEAYASPVLQTSGIINILKNAIYLKNFCKKHGIKIILAHQQVAALPLIVAKPFLDCKAFYFRHNTDADYATHPKKAWLMNRFINRMIPDIIAPSDIVYRYMAEEEGVPLKKMRRINYGYDFSQYEKPDLQRVTEIRENYSCTLLIISIARLVPSKRHVLMFQAVKQLVEKELDIKMICLGGGYLEKELQQWTRNNKLEQRIFLLGIQPNIFDYLAAADILLHLSDSEASNSVVKEAGLAGKTAIVCRGVGDFEDYMVHGQNGFLVNKANPVQEAVAIIENCYARQFDLEQAGNGLRETVLRQFDISNVELQYDELIKNGDPI